MACSRNADLRVSNDDSTNLASRFFALVYICIAYNVYVYIYILYAIHITVNYIYIYTFVIILGYNKNLLTKQTEE